MCVLTGDNGVIPEKSLPSGNVPPNPQQYPPTSLPLALCRKLPPSPGTSPNFHTRPGVQSFQPCSWGDSSWVGDGAASWVETVAETPMQASSRSPDGNPAAPYSTPPASLNQPLWREGSPGGPGEGSSKKLWPVSVWLHLQGLPWEGALGLVSMGVTGGIQWF